MKKNRIPCFLGFLALFSACSEPTRAAEAPAAEVPAAEAEEVVKPAEAPAATENKAEAEKAQEKAQIAKPAAAKPDKASAVSADDDENVSNLTVLPGFKAEHLYKVPLKKYGTWVGMTVDPEGRLIVANQIGGVYRVTVPLADQADVGDAGDVDVELIGMKKMGVHGVLHAFGSLYVAANSRKNKEKNGLWRLRDTDGDGTYDVEEQLLEIKCGTEHGFHSIVLGPDGESLYLVLGNRPTIPRGFESSRGPQAWSEDHLLPRMWDPKGHVKGLLAPGGKIVKVDPDAKHVELISTGYRNEFDIAFNPNGEGFTFDSDMEWDMGTPWYRPTRVCHVVSGSEFGWRSGAGKWPAYYADSLPSTIDIGLSSPTGVIFGTQAKFPAKYQRALFINDWTYGTMYAIHLQPDGATFSAEKEEFIVGRPLPLTDVVTHPQDGAMYFVTGGRMGQSHLYRLTYVGDESTAPIEHAAPTEEAQLRHELEKLHERGVGPEAIDVAWPHLDHSDRFVRWAARVAIEKQPVDLWTEKALAETRVRATAEAIIALARHGDAALQPQLIDTLAQVSVEGLGPDELLPLLRAYQLAFTRMGKPTDEVAQRVIAHIDGLFPSDNNPANVELAQLLLYLGAPAAVDRTVAALQVAEDEHKAYEMDDAVLARSTKYGAAAQTAKGSAPVAQQIALAYQLRTIENGWSPETRQEYFAWFPRALAWRGGKSLSRYISNIRKEALKKIPADDEERKALAELSKQDKTAVPREIKAPKGPARMWTVEEAVAEVAPLLKEQRDYKVGENFFYAVNCAMCHQFNGEAGGIGPDLTGVGNRYSLKDLMLHTIEPSAAISDQYGSDVLTMADGSKVTGRISAEEGGIIYVLTNPFDPESSIEIAQEDVVEREPSPISSMPPGLINTMSPTELADLTAFLMSGGNDQGEMFQPKESQEPKEDKAKKK